MTIKIPWDKSYGWTIKPEFLEEIQDFIKKTGITWLPSMETIEGVLTAADLIQRGVKLDKSYVMLNGYYWDGMVTTEKEIFQDVDEDIIKPVFIFIPSKTIVELGDEAKLALEDDDDDDDDS